MQNYSTVEEVSFEWSYHRIWSTDSKVRETLRVSIIDSGGEKGLNHIFRISKASCT